MGVLYVAPNLSWRPSSPSYLKNGNGRGVDSDYRQLELTRSGEQTRIHLYTWMD